MKRLPAALILTPPDRTQSVTSWPTLILAEENPSTSPCASRSDRPLSPPSERKVVGVRHPLAMPPSRCRAAR
jgi:hypothetical protein